ncbi:hypothetical protein CEXT_550481 [Caerostris extrusa]|uniref:Uncharacterized protein n=1 Tax=Caerostris extrusa TaxID=172846 RepID=A0AAV4Q5V8_CAEEX|nr:hypothetical protein CEXT_550481 [Caerostris extrusa]
MGRLCSLRNQSPGKRSSSSRATDVKLLRIIRSQSTKPEQDNALDIVQNTKEAWAGHFNDRGEKVQRFYYVFPRQLFFTDWLKIPIVWLYHISLKQNLSTLFFKNNTFAVEDVNKTTLNFIPAGDDPWSVNLLIVESCSFVFGGQGVRNSS